MSQSKILQTLATQALLDIPRVVLRQVVIRGAAALSGAGIALERVKVLPREGARALSRNRDLRGCLRGRKVFVLGNGPSLSRQDLSLLAGEVVFAVNRFACHPLASTLKPAFIGLSDPAIFRELDIFGGWFAEIRSNLPSSRIVVPLWARRIVEEQRLLPHAEITYLEHYGCMSRHEAMSIDITRAVPAGCGVVQDMILLAMYMGAEAIILLGVDHDMLAHPSAAPQYFSANYSDNIVGTRREEINKRNLGDYHWRIQVTATLWRAYKNLLQTASQHGIRILNATDGGFLDVFPRVEFRTVVGGPL